MPKEQELNPFEEMDAAESRDREAHPPGESLWKPRAVKPPNWWRGPTGAQILEDAQTILSADD